MLTGAIKNQIAKSGMHSGPGGISNPLEVITYLLFLRRLDDPQTLDENKATRLKTKVTRRIFPTGKDGIGKGGGRPYQDLPIRRSTCA